MIIEAHITSDKRIESQQKSIVDFLYVFLFSFSRHFWVFILQCVAVDSKPNVGSIFLAARNIIKLLAVIFKRSHSEPAENIWLYDIA